ncbi:hypothetical protein HBI56_202200 [Parastagonospora nodorum]|uniref:J domain-containing protein n=2 Tax=Phaeosphaeria nodorum (strain SN15 / ATCC MYA-4574 / FGSC 10173) TaxID=321614 RepID=A0A7U2HZ38_PHANO|nr:hypothetical protein SNOG_15550 [Parastagonospora nodorum SN15]KAH3905683.1 hypothetical protein HBH56_216730 [Parastagonospora nodorum]EAT76925.1 hypothetical protein SNOG_15550 [Parastagonospora nodorum SN15]KAH3922645.1 hypothetical protein HBH54_220800 [Parastagonospora nodorum]KAH3942053.1 hypothetical protein HBH53_190720 [Parastagonospora nodorum]KAH3961253.1 hypothetical protein HBH51_185400 [Parastagonospora nodorum]
MSNFRPFETAYKKAISNNRRPRDAVQYALNKYVVHMTEELNLHADAEMRECFVDEAFEIYCDGRNAHDTHDDAASAATKYIERELKDADSGRESCSSGSSYWSQDESRSGGSSSRWSSSQGESCGSGSSSSSQDEGSSGTRGKPVYNYNDPRNNNSGSSARSKPAYNYDDPRNFQPSSSTRAKTAYNSEDSYESYSEPRRGSEHGSCGCRKDSASRSRGEPLFDCEDMFDTLPRAGRGFCHCRKDRGHSRHESYTSSYEETRSSMPHAQGVRSERDSFHNHSNSHDGRSNGQWLPMPAGFGRFEFPSPIFTKGRSNGFSFFSTHEFRPTDHGSHNTRESRPSHHGEHDTRKSRPTEGGHNTREFKPSWYGSDNPHSSRPSQSHAQPRHSHKSPRSSEYGHEYTSTRAPPPRPSSHNTRSNPPHDSEPIGIKSLTCFYAILGISRTSTPNEIKAAYRKMSMKHHPDRVTGADKEKATAKMAEINQANDVLSDVVNRQFYDRTGCLPGLG